MNKMIDQDYLRKEQYKDPGNLQDRMQLHDRFSTNPRGWLPWVFDQFQFLPRARLLDLGCGPGRLWRLNRGRIPSGWKITLADLSPGMIEAARGHLGDENFSYRVADAQELPFDDDHFDGVIANHMLYHVPDRGRAVAQIRRVLKAGGPLYAATNGDTSEPGLREWVQRAVPRLAGDGQPSFDHFKLETGAAELHKVFDQVRLHRYADALEITAVEPLVTYVQSTANLVASAGELARLRRRIAAAIERHGCLRLAKNTGMFEAR